MEKKFGLLGAFMLLVMLVNAQQSGIQKQKFHWGREQDTTAGYAQAVKVGNVLYISGTVARIINPENITNLYKNLEKTLQHFGANFHNVVKENLYTTDIEAVKLFNSYRKVFYKGDFPAATWVQVSRLYMPDASLEVELIAHVQ